ncbi:MAG: glutamate--cysteine ligase [Magnetococcales bacterium]|nr:glutamate--cysteine ligase [Magnetococcales bacterium]
MPDFSLSDPITTRDPLIAWLESGCKPKAQWRVGTEHEKFGFNKRDLRPIPYEGPSGVRAVLEGMAERFGWQQVLEEGLPIALTKGDAAITLEPGGQLELAGAPVDSIHHTQEEINSHLGELGVVCQGLDIAFLGVGVQPKSTYEEIPWMPKGRYRVMREYLPKKGRLSLEMMTRTATVQANMDFSDERDMGEKFRLAMALQPLVTALFANSPLTNGQPNGFLSWRAEIWRFTDPDRCGWLPFVFEENMGFEAYADYALAAPMLFCYRGGQYQDAGGVPFGEFLAGRLPALPGERPTLTDWTLHLSTLFPDVRLKSYLEFRGADAGNSATLCALPAFWKGLLYHGDSMGAAWELVSGWSLLEREEIHRMVPKLGLRTPVPGGMTLREVARQVLKYARAGLNMHNRRNADGCDEAVFLQTLEETAESGVTPAERLLEAFHGRWQGQVDPIFREEEFDSFLAQCS